MFRIFHRDRRLVLAVAAILLLAGGVALGHHHDSPTAHHCALCSLVSHGATLVTGIGSSVSIVGLVLILTLPQDHPPRWHESQPLQARAPPVPLSRGILI